MTLPTLITKREYPGPGGPPGGLCWGDGALWLTVPGRGELVALDRETGGEIRRFPCPAAVAGPAFDGRSLWILAEEGRRLRRVDPLNGALIDERPFVPPAGAVEDLAWDESGPALWLAVAGPGSLERRRADDGEVLASLPAGDAPAGVEIAEQAIWCVEGRPATLVRLDMESGRELGRFALAGQPRGLAFDGWLFWTADADSGRLHAVRP